MRKTVAISLLLIIFINQLGYYLLHSLQQYQARQEIKHALRASIPESSLEIISATDDQLQWQEAGKEFYYRGQLYDVVNIKVLHGKTFYYCINDTKEKQLLENLAKIVKSSREDGNRKNIVKYQLTDTELPNNETTLPLFFSKPLYTPFTPHLTFSDLEVIPQPPRS